MKILFCIAILLLQLLTVVKLERVECSKRFYSNLINANSFVCVCNSTFCDTIEPVDTDDKEIFYQQFITSRDEYRLEKFKQKFEFNSGKSLIHVALNRSSTFQKIKG